MLPRDQYIDRRKCHRVVPMEVLSLGYPRTGTMSMQKALEILGYPNPYHFTSLFGNARDADMWQEAFAAKYRGIGTFGRQDFDQLLGHVGAVTDSPCVAFAAELIEAYPDAKVVLVEREIEGWQGSWTVLVLSVFMPVGGILKYTDPWWFGRIWGIALAWFKYPIGVVNSRQAVQNGVVAYERHYEDVRKLVPTEMLLEYRLGSGWEPLCSFLGKDIPKTPFPRLNESSDLKPLVKDVAMKALKNSVRNILLLGALVAGSGLIWRIHSC
ncbi:hypothetical protein BKA64DRAFT_590952, partial [Cadophora sp. MPI-SDFR-AT-0126]